jgi:hypothetical protein
MSTETNTIIPNYSDDYDKAQQYIKLALAIVNGARGTNAKIKNGGIYSLDVKIESITTKKR